MSKQKLAIVIGSIRPNRFGGHAAQWIEEIARLRTDFEVALIDLKDYPMPLFAEEASPLYAPSKDEVARRWQKKVGEFDAFIFTAAEYNRGPTAVLKNAPTTPTLNGAISRSLSSATAALVALARWSNCGSTPSSCRWRRSAARFTSCFPITWP